jgi:hypothetical protein
MKKGIIVFAIAAFSAALLPSCKKEYECVCTVNGDEVGRWSLGKQTRSDAEDACNAKASSFGVIAKCEID